MIEETDVIVVGAGFAGLYAIHRLRRSGWRVRCFEAGSGVGGTWYWNRYPGARCDVESIEYSYSFDESLEQDWTWSELYAGQPEILRYLEHVADRFDLRRDIRFDSRVESATYDDGTNLWTVRTRDGVTARGRFLVMATGALSSANVPDLPGLGDFTGRVLHTGRWPHEPVDFRGARVGVVGTGSSGIQAIPRIAEHAEQVVVFQRTPGYSVPARNRPLPREELDEVKANYARLRAEGRSRATAFGARTPLGTAESLSTPAAAREREFEERWRTGGFGFISAFTDLVVERAANDLAADFVRRKIRNVVRDPAVADALMPTAAIGCKRLCLDSGYFETYNRANVRLVDLNRSPIQRITPTGIRTATESLPLDHLVFATGFDAMTGALLAMDVRGQDGLPLREAWRDGPRTYLGLGVPRFPNMFIVAGPGSPSVLTNMVMAIEHHVEWIGDCLDHARRSGIVRIEATTSAAAGWVRHVNNVAASTLLPTCNSWYLGANIPGKPRVFMPLPGFPQYVERCATVAANGYFGFNLTHRRIRSHVPSPTAFTAQASRPLAGLRR
ncbi:Phenylacetone monooxygenase [Actinomadura rubteroloni]|uniref:Phenylacetone monooxygenase n=1 Tax=Actinomadura rubteroloni TaxID=1926885 RepID=A0A2P4UMT3_9ACTN|nr:NAD(P)/FAD-dependent oxidoreductase [Actinomadura rubteroloni]POM26355.1 Phenylacetone monooxygenase [Actinomadura rubteroloni]